MNRCSNCGMPRLLPGVPAAVPTGVPEGEALIQSIAQAASVKLPISGVRYVDRDPQEWR